MTLPPEDRDLIARVLGFNADFVIKHMTRDHFAKLLAAALASRDAEIERLKGALRAYEGGKWGENTQEVLRDSQWVAGAQFGWSCGQTDDFDQLNDAIMRRINDRAALSTLKTAREGDNA